LGRDGGPADAHPVGLRMNMIPAKFEIEVESKIDSLPIIADFIENVLSQFRADAGTVYKIQLAVDEATTNVINYAYPVGTGPLKIVLELAGEDILVTLMDKGKPFDPTTIPVPDVGADLEERKIGGLGIYFMRKLMDDISYSFDPGEGNKLTLRKTITRTGTK
jgi:serine/threonine-protein kinase RsbW